MSTVNDCATHDFRTQPRRNRCIRCGRVRRVVNHLGYLSVVPLVCCQNSSDVPPTKLLPEPRARHLLRCKQRRKAWLPESPHSRERNKCTCRRSQPRERISTNRPTKPKRFVAANRKRRDQKPW